MPAAIAWTQEMDTDVIDPGISNSEFKERWGVSQTAQKVRRTKLGKSRPQGREPSSRLLLAIPYIGTASDVEIGRRFGISRPSIFKYRQRYGIEVFRLCGQCANCGDFTQSRVGNVSRGGRCWCDRCAVVGKRLSEEKVRRNKKLIAAMSAIQAAITKHESDKNDGANYE